MSQSETKSSKNNLVMPLAIGGGLLLLFMNMGKAKAATKDDGKSELDTDSSAAALPKQLPNSSAQMTPQSAPKYTDVVHNEANEQNTDTEQEPESDSSASSYTAPNYNPTSSQDTEDEDPSLFPEDNLLPQSNSQAKWNERAATQQAKQQKMNPTGIRQNADQYKTQNNSQTKWNERASAQQAKQQKMRQGGIRAYADPKKPLMRKQTKWEMLVKANQAKASGTKYNPATNNSPTPTNPFLTQAQKLMAQQKTAQTQKSTTVNNKIFPLKQGQTNNYIKEIQRKMGVSPTGFFGTQTRAALLKKYQVAEVSETLYKQIITGKVVAKSHPKMVKKPIHRPKR